MADESNTNTTTETAATETVIGSFRITGKLNRGSAEKGFTDAIRDYFGHKDEGGRKAAIVIAFGAVLVRDYDLSNKEFSELMKAGDPRLGTAKDAVLAGEQVPMQVVKPVRGEDYAIARSHPYKQHGRPFRQLSYWQAGLPTSQKDVDEHKELDPKAWPLPLKIRGKEYVDPVQALNDGLSLETVHLAFASVIRPQVLDLSEYTASGKKGRMIEAFEEAKKLSVTLRFFSKQMNREQRKSVKLADLKGSPEAIYAAATGVLSLLYKGGSLALDSEQKAKLVAFIQDGTIDQDLPKTVGENEDGD